MRRSTLLGGILAGMVAVTTGLAGCQNTGDPGLADARQVSQDVTVTPMSPSGMATLVPPSATPQPPSTPSVPATTTGAAPVQAGTATAGEGKWTPAMAQIAATSAAERGVAVEQDPRTAAYVIMQPQLTPTVPATPTAPLEPGHVGLEIQSPTDGAQVPSSAVVRGSQRQPTPPDLHVWAFVKADVPDARWYSWHRGEIVPGPDDTWAIDLYLGGTTGTRHEVRIGTVDDAHHAELSTFLMRQPDQPLPDLPAGFVQEAQVMVTVE